MKKQSGFTLIELMVVMAIIAILATAGLSAYGGYLKKARDATRLEDIRALETVAISAFDGAGKSVSLTAFKDAVRAMNNGALLVPPLDGESVCFDRWGDSPEYECGYQYLRCTDGGYVLRVNFESVSNVPLYNTDKLNSGAGANLDWYDVGTCFGSTVPDGDNFIRD